MSRRPSEFSLCSKLWRRTRLVNEIYRDGDSIDYVARKKCMHIYIQVMQRDLAKRIKNKGHAANNKIGI